MRTLFCWIFFLFMINQIISCGCDPGIVIVNKEKFKKVENKTSFEYVNLDAGVDIKLQEEFISPEKHFDKEYSPECETTFPEYLYEKFVDINFLEKNKEKKTDLQPETEPKPEPTPPELKYKKLEYTLCKTISKVTCNINDIPFSCLKHFVGKLRTECFNWAGKKFFKILAYWFDINLPICNVVIEDPSIGTKLKNYDGAQSCPNTNLRICFLCKINGKRHPCVGKFQELSAKDSIFKQAAQKTIDFWQDHYNKVCTVTPKTKTWGWIIDPFCMRRLGCKSFPLPP